MEMSSAHGFKKFVNERLIAAAEEIFGAFEKTLSVYEEEILRQRRLLDAVLKPEIKLARSGLSQPSVSKEGALLDQPQCDPERSISLEQEESKPPLIKEEFHELRITEALKLSPSHGESDCSEDQTLFLDSDQTQTAATNELQPSISDEWLPSEFDRKFSVTTEPQTDFNQHVRTGPPMATSSNRPTPLPHDDGLWIFLQNRGIPERNIQKMQQDRIDSSVVGEIDDATMAAYIPAYGDRMAARRFCVEKRSRGGDDQSRLSLFEKIKRKKGTPNNKDKDEDFDEEYSIHPAKAHLKNKGASKMTRKIELGWIHDRRQVRKRTGGGTKGLDISKKATKTEILSLAKKLFFPNEKSRRGKWEEFSHDIVDFQNVYLDEDVTVGELYEIHKPGILRLYLFTERLTNGDEAYTEIVETADKQTDTARSVEQQEDTAGDDEQQTQKTRDSEQQTHTVEDVAHGTTKMSACVSTAVEMVDLTVLHESDLPIKEEQINTNAYTSTPTHAEIVCAVPPSPAYEPCT